MWPCYSNSRFLPYSSTLNAKETMELNLEYSEQWKVWAFGTPELRFSPTKPCLIRNKLHPYPAF